MRNFLLILCCLIGGAVAILVLFVTKTPSNPPLIPYELPSHEDLLWGLVQEWRTSNGLDQYIKSDILCEYAKERSVDIQTDFSHDIFKNDVVPKMVETGFIHTAENLADKTDIPATSLNSWLNSPPHRKALEDSYTHSCIKCTNTACVQLFAR